jgi:peptidylglycine monooxygenase
MARPGIDRPRLSFVRARTYPGRKPRRSSAARGDGEAAMQRESIYVLVGASRYRLDNGWARLPADRDWGFVSHVAVDSRNNVYVLQRIPPAVIVFDPDGGFVAAWGEDRLRDPHSLFVSADDLVYVVDRDCHEIVVFDTAGRELSALGTRHQPRPDAPFNHPTSVAVAPDGDIYVADGYGNSMIHRFSTTGEHKLSWGGRGAEPGAFGVPHAVWVDGDGRVLVADRENDRIQLFTADGALLSIWEDFYHPMDVFADAEGLSYISDQTPRLDVRDRDGNLVGRCKPALVGGHGICGDRLGNIYVAELPPGNLTRLSPA